MFILKQWTIINMHDWVEESLVVSHSKELIVNHHRDHVGGNRIPKFSNPLFDCTVDNDVERLAKGQGINLSHLDGYCTLETIDQLGSTV